MTLRTFKLFFSFLIIATFMGLSAAEVGKVDFKQTGKHPLPVEQLKFSVQSRPGVQFTTNMLDEDTKRLFATGNFADVQTEFLPMKDGKVAITFVVKLKPRVRHIEIIGAAKIKVHELGKLMKIHEGMLLNDRDLRESLEAIRKEYREKGYKDAVVMPAIVPEEDEVNVTIKIDEKLRLKVDNVKFEGAKLFSQYNLRHSIANRYSYMNWLPFINDYLNMGLLDRAELDMDKARLRDKYYDRGYLDFKVNDVVLTPDAKDPEFVNVTFKVEEGEPYVTSSFEIEGATVVPVEELRRLVVIAPKKTFSLADANTSCRNISTRYETMGYADVQCRADRVENFADHTVKVTFRLTEGRKYYVRDVIIVGNTATKDKVIRRELAIQPGDPVDPNRINVSKQRLMGMGYFAKVEADAVNADALNEKDVRIEVKESESRYQLRIGAGASDINSVFGMAEISTNNFDITSPENWFYGGGQRLRIQGLYGIDNAGFNVNFVEPWLFDIPLRLELAGFMNTSSFDQWDEWHAGGRVSLQKKIFDDFTSINVGYKFEVVRINEIDKKIKRALEDAGDTGTHRVSEFSITLGRDTRDSILDPTEGYLVNLYGAISPRILGSSDDFYKLEAKGSYYYSFFDKAIIAMIGAKIGTVDSFGNDDHAPAAQRYFLGGGDSIRGFNYRSISPAYNGGEYGGQTMIMGTMEVSHPIWGPLRGAAFVDAGGSFKNSYSINMGALNVGVGYGLRLRLPVINAPLRLDLAYPVVNNTEDSSKLRVHFNVGFTF